MRPAARCSRDFMRFAGACDPPVWLTEDKMLAWTGEINVNNVRESGPGAAFKVYGKCATSGRGLGSAQFYCILNNAKCGNHKYKIQRVVVCCCIKMQIHWGLFASRNFSKTLFFNEEAAIPYFYVPWMQHQCMSVGGAASLAGGQQSFHSYYNHSLAGNLCLAGIFFWH